MINIAGLQKVSLIDYPDRIAASVFLAGCNLDCAYCHNRWMIDASLVEPALAVSELVSWLETRKGLLDGVCVSGGEPTLYRELPDLVRAIKEMEFEVKLDTNGLLPRRLDAILDQQLVDYVAMDIKAPLDERYGQVAGCQVDLEAIHESMSLLRRHAPAYEFRTTVGPELDEEALIAIARDGLAHDGKASEDNWFLQLYQEAPGIPAHLQGAPGMGADALDRMAERLRQWVPKVSVRGT